MRNELSEKELTRFAVLTIFPEMIDPFIRHGIIRRAVEAGKIAIEAVDVRAYTRDSHHTTDDRPFGGGCGMVLKPAPLAAAVRDLKERSDTCCVHLTPQGQLFDQATAEALAREHTQYILICGRYEGIDERVVDTLVDIELSIGDYVLSGGELAAMVVIDAVARLKPGVLGGADSARQDSFSDGLLEHAHYTRPRCFEGDAVPSVLLSGDHAAISRWRQTSSLMRTFLKRPDLLDRKCFTADERAILENWRDRLEQLLDNQDAP